MNEMFNTVWVLLLPVSNKLQTIVCLHLQMSAVLLVVCQHIKHCRLPQKLKIDCIIGFLCHH